MQLIPCVCTGCVENPPKLWLLNLDKPYSHVMLSNPKHVSTLPSYLTINIGIFSKLTFKKETTNPE